MKIGIVGSGISGLGAAWLLKDKADVTIFEYEDRAGGHSHTMTVPDARGAEVQAVDTGFIVYNLATYPNLIALFDTLGVPTLRSDMSFGVSIDNGRIEYSGDSLGSLLGGWRNVFQPTRWKMVAEIVRFYRSGMLLSGADPSITLGEFLDRHSFSTAFREQHILPMAGAIWSVTPDKVLDFPARSFGNFFRNHGLFELSTTRRPEWRTVNGGSRVYVDKVLAASKATFVPRSRIISVAGGPDDAALTFADGSRATFDQVIIATHADQALKLLASPSGKQTTILGAFGYSRNTTYLHSDATLMPRRKDLWASWNYLQSDNEETKGICVSYWMNRLQSFPSDRPIFVSLNPPQPPRPELTTASMVYEHPQFDLKAVAAQTQLATLQGRDRLWFCGSYFGYGFHEDGLASGFAVAEALGARRPWPITDVSPAFRNATLAND